MATAKNGTSSKRKNASDTGKHFKNSISFASKDPVVEKENGASNNVETNVVKRSLKRFEENFAPPERGIKQLQSKCSLAVKKKSMRKEQRKRSIESEVKNAKSSESVEKIYSANRTNGENASNENCYDSSVATNRTEEKSRDEESTNSIIEISAEIRTQDRRKLASWGLPRRILQKYEANGTSDMFAWQAECLSNRELLVNNRNLVYSAPTSAGKTLVAEILAMKTMLERRKKVIFILPFVSVVREKMYYFQDLLNDSGLRVDGFMGGCSPSGGFAAVDMAIATIEKANSLINQLMEDGDLDNLGAVVIDELHLLGDPYRGYLLELLLTKLKYMNIREESVRVQLIGMSATLPNLELLANWLDAELYKTDYRPVPLNELCKIGTKIYDNEMKKARDLSIIPSLMPDADNILQLCIETISAGHSVLIFCPTKDWCEKLARQISKMFRKLGHEETDIAVTLREQLSTEGIVETLEQLKRSPAGLDDVLRNCVSFGVAFHHAGLTMDERDVVEGAFRSGALRVLTATSTLSSGVNLPARRVIIRSLMFHGRPLDTLTYKQMIGRAGRMGKDTAGESILVCKENERDAAKTLLAADLPPVKSCLEGLDPLVRALLEAVASEVAYTEKDIHLYAGCTLASVTSDELVVELTKRAVEFLIDNEFFILQITQNGDERWIASQLGKACLAASMPPVEALILFEELRKARRCFVLDTELHVIYIVTPLSSGNQIGQINWFAFLDIWKSISDSERRVGELVGVNESFMMTAIRGTSKRGKILDIHKRFYTALALHELVREIPLAEVCRKYGCCRGVVQNLQQSAATFAGMVTQFCKKLGWDCMELLIGQFQARLQFGVCRELLDLLRLPMLNGIRARSLYKEGITNVGELAAADVLDVERALHKALPFESGKELNGEHELDAARRNKMRSVFVTGRDGLTPREAASILVQEARTLVQNELGIDDLRWKERDRSTKKRQSFETGAGRMEGSIERREKEASVDIYNTREKREEIEKSGNNTSELPEDNNDGIEKMAAEIVTSVLDDRRSNQECSPDDAGEDVENRAIIYTNEAHGSSCAGSTMDPKANIGKSKGKRAITSTDKAGRDLPGFTNTEEAMCDRNHEKIAKEICQRTCEKNVSEIKRTKNATADDENIIGSKTSEEIFAEDAFGFTGIETAVDEINVNAKNSETNCTKDSTDKDLDSSRTGSPLNPKANIGKSKEHEATFMDLSGFTNIEEAIRDKNHEKMEICQRIGKKNNSEITTTKNPTPNDENIIGFKTSEEIFAEDAFGFTGIETAVDEINVNTKTSEKNCRDSRTGSPLSPKANIGKSKEHEVTFMDLSGFTNIEEAIRDKNHEKMEICQRIGKKNNSEITTTKNPTANDENIIGSKTSEEIFAEGASGFETAVDPINVNAKNREKNCTKDSTDKDRDSSRTGSPLNPKANFDKSREHEATFMDLSGFTNIEEAIRDKNHEKLTICQRTGEKNNSEITRTKNPTVNDENIIGSKTSEEIFAEAAFGFSNIETAVDPINVDAKTSEKNCTQDMFDLTNIESLVDFEAKIVEENDKDELAADGNNSTKNDIASTYSDTIPVGNADFTNASNVFSTRVSRSKNSEKNHKEISKFADNPPKIMTNRKENSPERTRELSLASPITSIRDKSLTKDPYSRSPSLFDDSLNIDTQECNILEQNVIDSLDLSIFGDTNAFAGSQKISSRENRRSDLSESSYRRSDESAKGRSSLMNYRRSPRISELRRNRSESLAWSDDSWNDTNGVIENIDTPNNPAASLTSRILQKNFQARKNEIANDKAAEKTNIPSRRGTNHEDRLLPKSRNVLPSKIHQKRKSSDADLSPIGTSLSKISQMRKLSHDSNKSDSDEAIIASQNVRSSREMMKNRMRLKLESLRKSRINKSGETTKRNKQLCEKDLLCEKCSNETIVLSSDDEIPAAKRRNVVEKTRIGLRKKIIESPNKSTNERMPIEKTAAIFPRDVRIVNVVANSASFVKFKKDVFREKEIAVALACETFYGDGASIGTKIIGITGIDGRKKTKKFDNCVYDNKKICGIAISWDGITAHYMPFDNTDESRVPVKERLDLLTDVLKSSEMTIRCFSIKETYKMLYNCCRIASSCKFLDPKTADWLLDPERSDQSFNALIIEHLPKAQLMLQRAGVNLNGAAAAAGFNVKNAIPCETRATNEAALTWHLMNTLLMKLEARSSTLLKTFLEIEMEILILLARMELTGFGVNFKSLQELSGVIQKEMSQLENQAYSLAGRKFNLSSSKSVAQVLNLYKGKKVSTKKAVLEHCENPIARLVTSWRKLSVTQMKIVLPLLRLAECNSRIHGNCITNTVTGRISMHEPNLQNVPRDFNSHDGSSVISVRMSFVSLNGNCILSADYCQLELRIMAHLSKEPNLCRILREDGDVFKNIAARWYNVAEEKIDDNMRQRTKQLCYGMIYGMGVKSLAETLDVTEAEAKEFLESFMSAYPGIRRWLGQVVEDARLDGYVTTLMARRRFLPALNSEISSERSQAERQAVNTKVQGSAADIAKKAMVEINERIRREFPDAPLVLTDNPVRRKLRSSENLARGGYLILQLHDELFYEVNTTDSKRMGKIIKESMEKSCKLRVPLPVKLKIGTTWGDLKETRLESL